MTQRRVDERLGHAFLHLRERLRADTGQDVAGEHELRFASGDARRVELLRRVGDAHVRHDGAVLLREAGHVEHAAALAFQMRRHAEQCADRHDTGAADARDEQCRRGWRSTRAKARSACGKSTPSAFFGLRSWPPSTVTKLGQNPFTHE